MPDDMPHLDDTRKHDRTIDLAVSDELAKSIREGERVVVALLAEIHSSTRPTDPRLRRQAYGWLHEQASREEREIADRKGST